MVLDGFAISNFRSFAGEFQYIGALAKLNLLVGRNNSGKSNILRFASYMGGVSRNRELARPEGMDLPIGLSSSTRVLSLAIEWPSARERLLGENSADDDVSRAIDAVFQQGPFRPTGDDLIWLEYLRGDRARIGSSADQIIAAQHAMNSRTHRAAISRAAAMFTGSRGGGDAEDLSRIIQKRLDLLADVPSVRTISAFRQVSPGEAQADFLSGRGLITELAKLQNPSAADARTQRAKFEAINRFLRSVLDDSTATIDIPFERDTINVQLAGRLLPLENLGTGVHQVVILAAAATLLDKTLVCIEEPEVHLHPTLQRKLLLYLAAETSNQYLVATHSAHLLDSGVASIFHVRLDDAGTNVTRTAGPEEIALVATDLGYRPSDLLQSNSIIWVEGPSDRIYLQHWLRVIAPELIEGTHYSIMFYGGRLLNHLTADDPDVREFISLRRLNRHISVVIDSDRSAPRTVLTATKRRVRDEFDRGPGLAWVTAGTTIENYVPATRLRAALQEAHPNLRLRWTGQQWINPFTNSQLAGTPKSVDKIRVARAVVNEWAGSNDWGLDLGRQMGRLAQVIVDANDNQT